MAQARNSHYDHRTIEDKWLAVWEESQLFQQSEQQLVGSDAADKLYLLFAFAYPSGSGLHVGHVESKTALDIVARYSRMNGKQVFFPVGWDAFGLPAENYAIKTGVPPVETTKSAIDTFRRQIKRLGISYDWANELATCHPGYYRWTQWLFLQLYKKDLAYQSIGKVNWCPSCQTVLANEQVVNGECERCGSQVIQKEMKQWYFKITEYQDELITGLDDVDWPEPTKQQQLHWIGKSEGARVTFTSPEVNDQLEIFTTAHDTIFGCTFMVIAPEHQWLQKHQQSIQNWSEIVVYAEAAERKTELERQAQKDKTGVRVEGISFTNPVTGTKIPLYVADYVLAGYGTGAIMAVPGNDERDHEFAQKYGLAIVPTAQAVGSDSKSEFISYAKIKQAPDSFTVLHSEQFTGQRFSEARSAILKHLVALGCAEAQTEYRLRDWLISRQRYWGAPIPVVYDPEGKPHPVKDEHLPWLLPTDVEFKPTGESPLKHSKEFIERTERLYGKGWRPEFDTMDTFVDSSWYYLRYVSSRNEEVFSDPNQLKQWLPVDFYMIGPEHIVLHLLYSRFFTKFLRDEGYLDFSEPFMKMRHQGMILGPDGRKMSKSKGNVINPDDVVDKFGADTLRTYEMFMGPIESDKPWDVTAVAGVYRFWNRFYRVISQSIELLAAQKVVPAQKVTRKLHQTLDKVSSDIVALKFNTAIAALMEFLNDWEAAQRDADQAALTSADVLAAIKIIAPFAPFLSEELFALFKHELNADQEQTLPSVHLTSWPKANAELAQEEAVTLAVQVNGKVRGLVSIARADLTNEELVITTAKALPMVQNWLAGKKITREIYIPNKIVTLVVE